MEMLKSTRPGVSVEMRRKSTRMPFSLNRSHPLNSGYKSKSANKIWAEVCIASLAMNRTVDGIIIAVLSESNARDSIPFSWEFDSNKTDESDLQEEKHFEQRIWTLHGIKID
jgi:hypothetical protein